MMFLGYVESWRVWSVADYNLDLALGEVVIIYRVQYGIKVSTSS